MPQKNTIGSMDPLCVRSSCGGAAAGKASYWSQLKQTTEKPLFSQQQPLVRGDGSDWQAATATAPTRTAKLSTNILTEKLTFNERAMIQNLSSPF